MRQPREPSLSVAETAQALGVSTATIYRWVNAGTTPTAPCKPWPSRPQIRVPCRWVWDHLDTLQTEATQRANQAHQQ